VAVVFAFPSSVAHLLELEKFMDVSKTPNLVPYVQKLVTCRQRIENINQSLTVINARVERMQKSVVTKQY
jgi:hypothetical protein